MSQPLVAAENPFTLLQAWKPYQIAAVEYRLAKLYPHRHPDSVRHALETCRARTPVAAGMDGLVTAVREQLDQ